MNQTLPRNTFRTTPTPVQRRENTRRIQSTVSCGQMYQNEHGYWRVDIVMEGLADLVPVFADGSPRPALDKRVESVANLNGPFYRLCPTPTVERGNGNAVGWAIIITAVVLVIGVGIAVWRALV